MESLLVLVGLVVVAIPVAIIYLLVSHSGLKGQVALLRRETTMLKRSLEDMRVTAETAPQQAQPAQQTQADPPAPDLAPDPEPDAVTEAIEAEVAQPETPAQTPEIPQPAPVVADEDLPPAARVLAARRAAASTTAAPQPKAARPPATPAQPLVFDRFLGWIGENWFYAVSAVSLALAGLFLVQYGMGKRLFAASGTCCGGAGLWREPDRGGRVHPPPLRGGRRQHNRLFAICVFRGGDRVLVWRGFVRAHVVRPDRRRNRACGDGRRRADRAGSGLVLWPASGRGWHYRRLRRDICFGGQRV